MFSKLRLSAAAILIAASAPILAPAPASAQSALPPLSADDDIIITATRLGQTAAETGTAISVITQDDIEQLGFDFVADALASAPGVTVNQNGGFGGFASVRIRGAASEQTLVLIDGISVNDTTSPGGGFDFARLDSASIERIEILKGPQSTLWGSDAIGGVVSIITKRPEEGVHLGAYGEIGSFDTFRGGASVDGSGERGDFRLALSSVTSEGFSKADEINGNTENDGYQGLNLTGRAGLKLGEARLDASLLYSAADTDFDSFVFGAQGNIGDGDERNETEELSGNISLKLPLLGGRLENLFLVGHSEIDRQNFAGSQPSFGAEGDRTTLRYQGNAELTAGLKAAFGAEREESRSGETESTLDGVFGLLEFKPLSKLTLTGGLRLDDHSEFGSETTARAAAAYKVTDELTLRGTWGQGFKAPSIFQTTFFCCGASAPNADLRPETSDGFDIGLDYRTGDGRGEFGVTYFDQSVDNLINFDFSIGGYNNIPGAERSGVELYAGYQILDWLNLKANYAYIDAVDNAGETLIRVPEHSGDIILGFTPDGPISGALLLRYNGEEQDSSGTVEDWTRVDVNAAYALSDSAEVFGRLENLLDTQYQQILGFGTAGRSGSIGVRLRY